jgi:hypothetical protein
MVSTAITSLEGNIVNLERDIGRMGRGWRDKTAAIKGGYEVGFIDIFGHRKGAPAVAFLRNLNELNTPTAIAATI